MASKSRVREIPAFASLEEEFEFWESHEPEEFEDGVADDIVLAIKPRRKVAITLRLDESLLAEIRKIAQEEDMPYQTLTRALIIQGVSRLQRARASRS
jgi:predicted DNA binding CopG/RHH family protein